MNELTYRVSCYIEGNPEGSIDEVYYDKDEAEDAAQSYREQGYKDVIVVMIRHRGD